MSDFKTRPLDRFFERNERIYIGLGLKIVFVLVFIVGTIWGGVAAFRGLQVSRLLGQAEISFKNGDDRWASIAARRVSELKPKNAQACRILAQVMERQNHPSAVDWRRKLVTL